MAVIGEKELNYNYDYNTQIGTSTTISKTSIGFGFAAGAKFLARNGFTGEVYLGAGRIFGESFSDAYPRVGVSLGKRF